MYRDITGMWPHRLSIQWEWSDCSANIDGPIRMTPKVGRMGEGGGLLLCVGGSVQEGPGLLRALPRNAPSRLSCPPYRC